VKPLALVVENDAGTRKLLDALLKRAGVEADIVGSGREAMMLMKHAAYSVVLLDLLLEGITGFDILKYMKQQQPEMLARTLVLSSASEKQLDEVRTNFAGVQVIRKPFDISEVLTAVGARSAGASRVADLAEEFCRRSIVAGASAGLVATLDANGIASAWTHFGYAPGLVESYWPMSIEAQYPICAAMRNAKPVWIASIQLAAAEYPLLAPVWKRGESKAVAAIPLIRDEVVIGAAGWSFHQTRLFAERERNAFHRIVELIVAAPDAPSQSAQRAHA